MTEPITRYFTFGYAHTHVRNGHRFGKDTLVKITAPDPRAEMHAMFGNVWAFEYDEPPEEKYWPAGMVDLSPTVAVPTVEPLPDAEQLRIAMMDCATVIAAFVGIDLNADAADGNLHEFDAAKRDLVVVDRTVVPEVLWRTAIMALDFLALGVGFVDKDAPPCPLALEDQLAALLKDRDQ